MSKKLNLPEDEIIDLYLNDKLSTYRISIIYDCSNTTIKNILKYNNIKSRTSYETNYIILPDKEIINLYINDKLSLNKISIIYNCSYTTIGKVLQRNNIKLRSPSEAQNIKNNLNLIEKDIIYLYTVKQMSKDAISRLYNCSVTPIHNILINNNIPLKTSDDMFLHICTRCKNEFIGTKGSYYCDNCGPVEYCYKYNENCREDNRERYNRRCFICDKTETENKRKLSTHHIDYNKNQGCDSTPDWKLVPLCNKCHGMTGGSNENRKIWKDRLLFLHKEYWSV